MMRLELLLTLFQLINLVFKFCILMNDLILLLHKLLELFLSI